MQNKIQTKSNEETIKHFKNNFKIIIITKIKVSQSSNNRKEDSVYTSIQITTNCFCTPGL